jgi:hypothetical protein
MGGAAPAPGVGPLKIIWFIMNIYTLQHTAIILSGGNMFTTHCCVRGANTRCTSVKSAQENLQFPLSFTTLASLANQFVFLPDHHNAEGNNRNGECPVRPCIVHIQMRDSAGTEHPSMLPAQMESQNGCLGTWKKSNFY